MLLDDVFWYLSNRFGKKDERGQVDSGTIRWVVGVFITLLVIYVLYKLAVMVINDN